MRALGKWRKIGEHTFRRIRPDGELGDVIRFEVGSDGKATAYWQSSNRYVRSSNVPTIP